VSVRLRPEAEVDIAEARNWYEQQRPGLGADFLNQLESLLVRMARSPRQFPKAHGELRRALVRRFPYAVYFLPEHDGIVVFAVLHQRRSSTALQTRWRP
jgi:toxin ParE1/3/4